MFLEHAGEALALARFAAPTIVHDDSSAFTARDVVASRVCLPLERHGSLDVEDLRAVLAPLGLGVTVSPGARERLRPRDYPDQPAPAAQVDIDP